MPGLMYYATNRPDILIEQMPGRAGVRCIKLPNGRCANSVPAPRKPPGYQGGPKPADQTPPDGTGLEPKPEATGFNFQELLQGEIFGIPTWVFIAGGAALLLFKK